MALKAFIVLLHGDGAERAGFAEAVVPLCVADDQVIEEPDVENVRCVAKRSVSRASSGLGVGSPLGWLWITINAVVPGVRHAGTNTSGIDTGVLARVPRESRCHARRRCFRREAGDSEHFDRLVAKQGSERGCAVLGLLNASVATLTTRPSWSRTLRRFAGGHGKQVATHLYRQGDQRGR